MVRILAFGIGAVALLVVLWLLFWGLIHTLIIAFWLVVVALLGLGLFRIGRWSRRAR